MGDRLDALVTLAQERLGIEASGPSRKRLSDRLRTVAAELALEWILGERRFESQNQQMEHWLARLYEDVFSDEQPEASRIYARFGLTLPRAQYVTRLLLARRSAQWRDAAKGEVLAALESYEAKSIDARKAKTAQTQRWEMSLSRGGYDELVVFYDLMTSRIAGPNRPSPPKRTPSSSSMIFFLITAETTLAILELVRKVKP
jgi:hypothetical protein